MAELVTPCKANNFRPPVKSIFWTKEAHAKRGIRLIDFASLRAYLRKEFEKAA